MAPNPHLPRALYISIYYIISTGIRQIGFVIKAIKLLGFKAKW